MFSMSGFWPPSAFVIVICVPAFVDVFVIAVLFFHLDLVLNN